MIGPPYVTAALLALGGVITARPAGGQPAALPAAVGALPPGTEVRVSRGGFRLEGRVATTAGDTLTVAPQFGGPPLRTPLTRGDSVWVTTGRAWRRGALVGAGVGAAVLSAVAIAYGRAVCESPGGCGGSYPHAVLLGVTVGGAGGAALGAAVGSTVRRWRRVHP